MSSKEYARDSVEKYGKRDDAERREREREKISKWQRISMRMREKRARLSITLTLSLSSRRVSVFGVVPRLALRQSKEPTFAIRSGDGSACEEPGSRNKIDVEKEKRWSR